MKSSTQKSYQQRIERVVGFLNDQLNNNPSLEMLAITLTKLANS